MSEEGRIRSNTVLALDQIPNSRYSSKTLTTSQHNTTFSLDLEYECVFVCGLFRQRSRRWHSQEQLEFSWLHIWLASGSLLLLNWLLTTVKKIEYNTILLSTYIDKSEKKICDLALRDRYLSQLLSHHLHPSFSLYLNSDVFLRETLTATETETPATLSITSESEESGPVQCWHLIGFLIPDIFLDSHNESTFFHSIGNHEFVIARGLFRPRNRRWHSQCHTFPRL